MGVNDLPVVAGIASAAAIGALLGAAVLVLVGRTMNRPVDRPGLSLSLAIALAVTATGVLVGFLTSPEGSRELPRLVLKIVGVVLLPGIWAMNIFGRHSLDSLLYFGSFALSTAVWSVLAYILVGKHRARA